MNNVKKFFLFFFFFLCNCINLNHKNPSYEKLPPDNPVLIKNTKDFEKLIAPYVSLAIETLPYAKRRFLDGLKKGEILYLVIRLYDNEERWEQVFVKVRSWTGKKIKGEISNYLSLVKKYKYGQIISFSESDVIDWVILKPDGEEEGNFVGKFLDSLQNN